MPVGKLPLVVDPRKSHDIATVRDEPARSAPGSNARGTPPRRRGGPAGWLLNRSDLVLPGPGAIGEHLLLGYPKPHSNHSGVGPTGLGGMLLDPTTRTLPWMPTRPANPSTPHPR